MLATDEAVISAVLDSPWERQQAAAEFHNAPALVLEHEVSDAIDLLAVDRNDDDGDSFESLPADRTIRVSTDLSWAMESAPHA
jgi:hypothetical protein